MRLNDSLGSWPIINPVIMLTFIPQQLTSSVLIKQYWSTEKKTFFFSRPHQLFAGTVFPSRLFHLFSLVNEVQMFESAALTGRQAVLPFLLPR